MGPAILEFHEKGSGRIPIIDRRSRKKGTIGWERAVRAQASRVLHLMMFIKLLGGQGKKWLLPLKTCHVYLLCLGLLVPQENTAENFQEESLVAR